MSDPTDRRWAGTPSAPTPSAPTALRYSLVIPVYRDQDRVLGLVAEVVDVADRLSGALEAIFVVNGSPDQSAARLREALPGCHVPSVVVELSRNFGSFAAVRCGMELAAGDYTAVIDADLLGSESLIEDLYGLLAADEADVVVGERVTRRDDGPTRSRRSSLRQLCRRVAQSDVPGRPIDVFGCNRAARQTVLGLRESNTSLIGLLMWIGFRRVGVPYEQSSRPSDKSEWTFGKRVRYATDSIFSSTDLPIRLLLFTGVIGTFGSLAFTFVVFIGWLLGLITVPGYTPLMMALLVVGGLTISALGIIGSYVWRTYENTKQRPLSVIRTMNRYAGQVP